MVVEFSNMGTGRIKGGLPRCRFCQNPHNQQVAAVFDFNLRLASHPFMHPRLQATRWHNFEAVCFVGWFDKILTFDLEIVALENG